MNPICIYNVGKCIVFPNQKRALIIPNVPVTTASLIVDSMTNGIH
jgi:hypothetical protein